MRLRLAGSSGGLRWRWLHLRRLARDRRQLTGALGWPAFLTMAVAPVLGPLSPGPLRSLRLRGFRHPLYYRDGTTDEWVIRQVFVERQYACVGNEPDVRYLLDLGANIGCASFDLLHRYPGARAVVVEPDPGNMAVCRRNLAPFADRVTFVQAGVWSASVPMAVERGGGEWAFRVRPANPGERPNFTARTVPDLIAGAGFPRVDLLKMDVEGAEAEVFRGGADWLRRVRTLAVELHGPDCEAAALRALARFPYAAERSGELTVFRLKVGHPGIG